MSIPPQGWGAVEILIWDYYNELTKLNHDVTIINKIRNNPQEQSNPNTQYCKELIKEINNGKYDFVHLHYDALYHILQYLDTKIIGFTSHYPYIDNELKHSNDGFTPIFKFMLQNKLINNTQIKYINFVLAQKDIDFLIQKGADSKYLFLLENGIDSNSFIFKEKGDLMNKTIYLGQINERKGQYKYCHLQNIDIIGPNGDTWGKLTAASGTSSVDIFYCDIRSIIVQPAGYTYPYIRILIKGTESYSNGNFKPSHDPYSVDFQVNQLAEAENFKTKIYKLISEHRNTNNATIINQISSADELEKFAGLLQKGIITQEEFELKKKQILGL